jgi:hypothetical protein
MEEIAYALARYVAKNIDTISKGTDKKKVIRLAKLVSLKQFNAEIN